MAVLHQILSFLRHRLPAPPIRLGNGTHHRPIFTRHGDDAPPRRGADPDQPISADEERVLIPRQEEDPKGKKPVLFVGLGEEEEKESSAVMPCCSFCTEANAEHECVKLAGCSHVYCLPCIAQYVAAMASAAEENAGFIRCPDPQCWDGFLDPQTCQLILLHSQTLAPAIEPEPEPEPDRYCSICMEAKHEFECVGLTGCPHLYCAACISQYVTAKVEENALLISCPDPGCKTGFLEPEMCRLILPREVFDRWGDALCDSVVTGSRKFYCPYKDCSALLINEGGDNGGAITDSECPHCSRLFCARCKVPWHDGVTCEAYQKLGANERAREDLLLMKVAKERRWQRCPKCGFFVERTEGCVFIKCRCSFCFCYVCATEIKKNHHCEKCKRTWA